MVCGKSKTFAGSATTLSPDFEPIPVKRKNSNLDIFFLPRISSISNLKTNLRNQEIFNQIISKIISSINIEEQKNSEDNISDKERFKNIDNNEDQERKDGKANKEKEEQELTFAADLPETTDLSEKNGEEDKFEEVEDESGISKKQYRKIFSKNQKIIFILFNFSWSRGEFCSVYSYSNLLINLRDHGLIVTSMYFETLTSEFEIPRSNL